MGGVLSIHEFPSHSHVSAHATEPQIGKPLAMNWDERGRLWLCETVDYPNELQPTGQGRDRIRICEDTNGDGRAELVVGAPNHLVNGLTVGRVTLHTFDIPAASVMAGVPFTDFTVALAPLARSGFILATSGRASNSGVAPARLTIAATRSARSHASRWLMKPPFEWPMNPTPASATTPSMSGS